MLALTKDVWISNRFSYPKISYFFPFSALKRRHIRCRSPVLLVPFFNMPIAFCTPI